MEFKLNPEKSRVICAKQKEKHYQRCRYIKETNLRSAWHRLTWWTNWSWVGGDTRYRVMVIS